MYKICRIGLCIALMGLLTASTPGLMTHHTRGPAMLPPEFEIRYTNPPPTSDRVPKPCVVYTGDDPGYKLLCSAFWKVRAAELEEIPEQVRLGLNGEPAPGTICSDTGFYEFRFSTTRKFLYVQPLHDSTVEHIISKDVFLAIYEVWYPLMLNYRAAQIAKFGKAEW
jgi:hypothetical protein